MLARAGALGRPAAVRDAARSPWTGAIACFALALLARLLVAWQVEIPGRDGATYLWMGERIAQGDFAASFATVFPPVYPWCIALVLWATPITDVVFAGQLASLLPAALAVFPLFGISLRLGGPLHAHAAGLCYALGAWFARHPADCMSEGPFYLWVALVVLLLLRRARGAMLLLAAGLSGLAFGTRPEGAGLLLVGTLWLWRQDRRAAALFAATGAVSCMPFVLGYSLRDGTLQLTPKAAFNWEVGVGNAEIGGPFYYVEHLLRVPGHLFEAVGYVATALALLGLWSRRRLLLRGDASLPILLLCLQIAIIPLVRATIRFVSGYGILLLPFAGDGLRLLASRWRPRAAVAAALAHEAARRKGRAQGTGPLPGAAARSRRTVRERGAAAEFGLLAAVVDVPRRVLRRPAARSAAAAADRRGPEPGGRSEVPHGALGGRTPGPHERRSVRAGLPAARAAAGARRARRGAQHHGLRTALRTDSRPRRGWGSATSGR